MSSEPTILCPNCKTEIKLTESLAAPLVEATRRDLQAQLALKDQDIAKREAAIHAREGALAEAKTKVDQLVLERLTQERAKIALEEGKRAKQALAAELDAKARENADLREVLDRKETKLLDAQKAQVDLIRKERELDEAKGELELTVEKRIQQGLSAAKEKGRTEAEAGLNLKVMEAEERIASMQQHIETLKRKAEQGSQQLQGEVLELDLEARLEERFPGDSIYAVPKGEHGGDILHRVVGVGGQTCGTILWESKRTKNWSPAWLVKLRDDQRDAKAELAVLVSEVLPKGVETFELVDKIWVVHPRLALAVGAMLRQSLLEVAAVRKAADGQQTKMGLVYQYVTSSQFRRRVEAMIEAFSSMKEDLDTEKKVFIKHWAKRDRQIERMMEATLGMHGDLQGIAGQTLPELEGAELEALGASAQLEG